MGRGGEMKRFGKWVAELYRDTLEALGLASANSNPPAAHAPVAAAPATATQTTTQTTTSSHKASWWGLVIGSLLLITIVVVVVGLVFAARNSNMGEGASPSPVAAHGSTGNGGTWKYVQVNHSGNRWFANGIREISQAKTKAQAEEAAQIWLSKVKLDPNLLIGAYSYLVPKGKAVKRSQLIDKKGWATAKAVQVVAQIQIALGQSRITPSVAPSNGTNSGVASGRVVAASSGGIGGNRKAIKVVLPKGKTVWKNARCGNPVVQGPPPVPLSPKLWWLDPYAQGHAPVGGGQNADPGPGVYDPDPTHPPDDPYTPPPSPTPIWTPTPGTTATPTAEPTPLPTPTAEVPTPAASGTVLPPGM